MDEKKTRHNTRKPLTKGVAKVPIIMQMEALECGAACLAMVLAYYRKWVPLEQVRLDCGVSRDGSKASNMVLAARNYGLIADGYSMGLEAVKSKATFPCIIHWNYNHFVVLCGFRGNKAIITDPAHGTMKIPMSVFDRSFTGICLQFSPGEGFVQGGKPKSTLAFAKGRLEGAGAAVIFVMLTTLISSLFGLANPVVTRVFYDYLLTGDQPNWLYPFIGVMAALAILQLIIQWVNAIYSLRINGKMTVIGSSTYLWKILRLPIEFFTQRMSGDIVNRQKMNASIASTIVNTLAPLLLNTVMMFVYLFFMIKKNLVLTLVGVGAALLNLIVARIISSKRVNLTRVSIRDESKLAASTMTGISMTETIKSTGAENGFFQNWAGYQASVNTSLRKLDRLNIRFGIIPALLSQLANYLVLFLGVGYAMRGGSDITIGVIAIFQGFLGAFLSPAMSLISAGQTFQEMRTQMERVEDVMRYPDDPYVKDDAIADDISYDKLRGNVELKNVTFGYSRLGEPLIKDFSLTLKKGSRVAIVGKSGCGKSTISKLISGLYRPWSGEILFDGKGIDDIPRAVFTGSVAVVDQDIILFEDSIKDNITMWDSSIKDFEVIMACRDARIHDDILARPGGYKGKIIEGGNDLSGGQRQRLEIARVLAQDPSILILDEATSALDAKTEKEVIQAIKARSMTCLVVAHRLSTIRDCDEIIVMDNGEIIERGSHEELYAKGGYYAELISLE